MKLGEFIENFSHNNTIRLVYNHRGGHEIVLESWDCVSMDWEILAGKGIFRHYINNEVLGLASIGGMDRCPEAINIVIERLDKQPIVDEKIEEQKSESVCTII